MNSFFEIGPEDILLIIQNGRIILFDEILYTQLDNVNSNSFSKAFIYGACKYVYGDLKGLIKEIRKYAADVKFSIEIEED